MIISEKGLARSMESSMKIGYKLLIKDEEVSVMGSDWLVNSPASVFPRKELALIVEHLGYIPRDCCLTVSKMGGEVFVQSMMEDAFADEADTMTSAPELIRVKYTGVELCGRALHQSREGRIIGINPAGSRLLESPGNLKKFAAGDKSILWGDDDSAVYIRASRPDEDAPELEQWTALERIRWCGWGDEE